MLTEVRLRLDGREGDVVGPTIPVNLPLPALGVEKGEPGGLDGDERVREIVGLGTTGLRAPLLFRVGLSAPLLNSREFSC